MLKLKKLFQLFSLILISVLVTGPTQAQVIDNFPGSIPLKYERAAASDLVFGGKILTPDEARALYDKKVVADLSHLNPDESSELWKNKYTQYEPYDLNQLELKSEAEELTFISDKSAPNGQFAFLAQKKKLVRRIKNLSNLFGLEGS